MLRSSNCVLTGKTPMEFSKLNECPLDPGKSHFKPVKKIESAKNFVFLSFKFVMFVFHDSCTLKRNVIVVRRVICVQVATSLSKAKRKSSWSRNSFPRTESLWNRTGRGQLEPQWPGTLLPFTHPKWSALQMFQVNCISLKKKKVQMYSCSVHCAQLLYSHAFFLEKPFPWNFWKAQIIKSHLKSS